MQSGPKLNDISKSFTARDSLGIESVAASLQREVCPIVNTVTPRAFYWPFMVWIYYDFYKYSGIKERSYAAFDRYLKRQDYFFVMATLLTEDSDQSGLVGKRLTSINSKASNGPYAFDPAYFQATFGGMQYYNAGCLSMRFVSMHNDSTNEDYTFPRLTQYTEEMAIAFENVIKGTRYYQNYRIKDIEVPQDVLKEYGKVIRFDLEGFDDCKAILKNHLFNILPDEGRRLTVSADYIAYLVSKYSVKDWSGANCRRMLYDKELEGGRKIDVSDAFLEIARRWEIIIGRQYFTSGLEMIWKYMLIILSEPFMLTDWILQAIQGSKFDMNLSDKLESVLSDCIYDYSNRERMIDNAIHDKEETCMLENGVRIILSVYNRFRNRNDFGDEKEFFKEGNANHSISLQELFSVVDEYRDKSLREFLVFVMKYWLVDQHYKTAIEKTFQGKDGFYIEEVDGKYYKKHDFDIRFQDIRLKSLAQVMTDLDML